MVLGYMRAHMYSLELQCIINCVTYSEAYQLLCHCHEKHSGLMQIQLIQRMMQIWFDNNPVNCETAMALLHDLIYCADRISHIDITRLALLFTLMSLCSTHPSIHEALAPVLMDGSITLEALETCLHYFYEMQATHGPDFITFPAIATPTTLPSPTPPAIPPTLTMPATIPPHLTLCPNCKHLGHTIEFCIAPGGKMAGQSTFEASN